MSVDAFLRALQRDVAWDFFYGIVNFDGVIGTVNHYGTVDLFAGRYNDAYRKAELDHLENFETAADPRDVQGHARRLDERRLRPVRRPEETGQPFGVKNGQQRRRSPATGSRPAHGRRARRRAAAQRRRRAPDQPHVRRRRPGRARGRGRARLRGRGGGVQPVRLPVPLRRDLEPVGRVGVQGQPVLPDDRGVHPADHPRQRPGRVVRAALRRDPLGGRGPRHRRPPGPRW